MRPLFHLALGLVFGLGLLVSDMANPARVLAFLDALGIPRGTWDPTLLFVMGGATGLSALAWAVARRRRTARWAAWSRGTATAADASGTGARTRSRARAST